MKDYNGEVKMFDETIVIDKQTKKGYEKVLKKIDPLLCGWAARIYMPGYSFEDIKQELSLIAIEGINAFDPSKGVKLSSFLTTHIKNKTISKLKSVNKLSNDASLLKMAAETCSCPSVKKESGICDECGLRVAQKYRSTREEFSFSSLSRDSDSSGGDQVPFENYISNSNNFFGSQISQFDEADISMALERLSQTLDEVTFDILKMVWIEGRTIKYAAEKVGISGWGASMHLRRLSTNQIINDLLSDLALKDLDIKDE